jgi:hypothetical protein
MPQTYETDIEIDESALDVEWVGHASLMLRYTRTAAESHKEMNLAKARLDYVKARLDKEIRENPDAYGLGTRITEGSISSAIRLSDDFEEANHGLIEKEFEYEVAAGVVRSFDHRKSALENLVRLHGQSYFSGPTVPRDLVDERSKRANRHIRFQRRS